MYRVRLKSDAPAGWWISVDAVDKYKEEQYQKNGKPFEHTRRRDAEKTLEKRAKANMLSQDKYEIIQVKKEKTMATKKNTTTTEELLEKLLVAVTAEYKDDAPTAGIVFSQLKDGTFYASVKRYNQQYTPAYSNTTGKKDVVVAAASGNKSARSAIINLTQTWLNKSVARDQLANALANA